MRAAVERRGWVGLVGGEPGIDKTRLAAACVGQLAEDGFGFAWVSCPEGDSAPPFWVWDRLLDQLGAGDALRAEAGEADPELARFLLFDAVAAAIRKAAADRPLLLVMDDLHWADPASRRLLAAIRGVLATLPVVALCTYRDTDPGAAELCAEVGPERHLMLGGLAPGELAAAVRMATGSAVPDALVADLHARTVGNPYFAAEAIRLLRAEGRLDTSAQLPPELLPSTVRAALERRLAWLPAATTELLRVAALLGDELDPPLLAEIAGEPLAAVASALAAARAARVTGRDRFAHPLVREVLQAQLGPVDRLRWHARIGALLAGRYRAGVIGPAPAARHLLAAAEMGGKWGRRWSSPGWPRPMRCVGSATRTRCGCCRPRWPWLVPAATGGELLCALGEAALATGDRDGARAAYAEAAEVARRTGRAELLAAAALGAAGGQGGFEIDLRDPDRVAALTEALQAQPEGDSRARAALLGRLSLALAFTEATLEQREALSTEAVAMARRLGDPVVLAAALAARCDAVSGPDHVAERRAAAAEIIKLARMDGDRTGEMLGLRLLVVALAEAGAAGPLPGANRGRRRAFLPGVRAGRRGGRGHRRPHAAMGGRRWLGAGRRSGVPPRRRDMDAVLCRRTVRLRDSKGLRDLAVLVGRPDERTHVSELAGAGVLPGPDAGPVVDRRALAAYRERLRRIAAELDSLDAGAPEAGTLNKEREALLAELSATTGLGGRPRTAGSPAERMRKAVTYRIRHAISRVADAHPELGRHLRASVRTGTWCSYTPEHRVDWRR